MTDLVVDNLKLRLGTNEILRGVSFAVARGKATALLGPSGSGKTTLLRAVAGLETPHTGSIRVGDQVFFDSESKTDLPAERRGLGLVFQSYALWPNRTVFDNVAYGLKLRGVARGEIADRVIDSLKKIGLANLEKRYPHQLSGGQQQRVALARALVYEPQVILLDEPLSNLDAKLRDEARIWLRQLIVSQNLAALCVTHDQTEAMALADSIVLLNGGVVEQEGTPGDLYNGPRSQFAAEFMGANNRLSGLLVENQGLDASIDIEGHRLSGLVRTSAKAGDDVTAIIRVERVRVSENPGPNRLPMSIATQMYLGDRWEIIFTRGGVSARLHSPVRLKTGNYFIEFPAKDLWIF